MLSVCETFWGAVRVVSDAWGGGEKEEKKKEEDREENEGRRGLISEALKIRCSFQYLVLRGWGRLHTILSPSVSVMRTLLSLHPNYMSKPTSSWSFLGETGKSWSSCPDGLGSSAVALFLASSCFPPWLVSYPPSHVPTLLTFVLYRYNLKPLGTAPKIRISLVISHLFHLFNSSLSPCCVSGIRKTETGSRPSGSHISCAH